MIKKIILVFILIMFCSAFVSATSINPGKTVVMFEPGKKVDFEFTVTNTHGPDKSYYLLLRSTSEDMDLEYLDSFMSVPLEKIPIDFGRSHRYKGTLILPESLTPGEHKIFMTVMDDQAGDGTFGARATVAYKIEIYSPYPGKYVKARMFEISPVQLGGTAVLNVQVMNLGTEDLSSVTSIVDLYDSEGYVGTFNSPSMPMKSKATHIMPIYVGTKDLAAGRYSMKGKVMYDGLIANMSTSFKLTVGDIFIDIIKISNQTFYSGKINRFTLDVLSKWNLPIDGVYVSGRIERNGGKKGEFRTESITVDPISQGTITAFADLTNLVAGVYDFKLTLNYAGKKNGKTFQIRILPGELEKRSDGLSSSESGSSVPWIPILLIVVLILVNLLAYTYIRGKGVSE